MDLSGRKFRGEFYRDPKYVQEELEHKKDDPKALELYKEAMDEFNAKYDFEFRITDFDHGTGLFTADIRDHFGKSIAAGAARNDVIKFLKLYANFPGMGLLEAKPFLLEHGDFRIFEYYGQMLDHHGDTLEAAGSYKRLHENERTGGFWSMESID